MLSSKPRSPYGWGAESTFSTNDRPRTRVSRCTVPGKRDSINEVAVASRATMAHFVHILGNCEILLASYKRTKKGDAGKPALHETLVQMNKEWRGTVRDGREEIQSVASSCHSAVNCRTVVLAELIIRACQVVKNMVFRLSLRRRLWDENPRSLCYDASE
jgi:hypothetical protein